jgi:hypothetical protein
MDTLIRTALERGDPRRALELALRLRDAADELESARRLQIEALLACHDPIGARAEAEALREWLAARRRAPEPATQALLRRLEEAPPAPPGPRDLLLEPELVGREREFATLLAAWRDAREGRPRGLHVEGASGFGKSRLLRELAGRIAAEGGRVLQLRAHSGDRRTPCAFAGDLALLLGRTPGALGVSGESAGLLVGLSPPLADVYPAVQRRDTWTDDLPHRRGAALVNVLQCVADEGPVVLLLDDVHWMDRQSRVVVCYLLERLPAGVLAVTAGRPYGYGEGLPVDATLALRPLSPSDVEALLGSLGSFAEPRSASPAAEAVHRAADGSPLHVMEILRLAIQRGALRLEDGCWEADDLHGYLESLGPHPALEERIRGLPDDRRDLLLCLAGAGGAVAEDPLARTTGAGPALPAVLQELEVQGFVAPGPAGWTVAHDQIADRVMALAGPEARLAAVRRVGQALAEADAQPEQLHRAGRLLMDAGETQAVARTFRAWIERQPRPASPAEARELAARFLGEHADPTRVTDLVRSLPPGLRASRRQLWIGGAVAAAVALAALLAAGAWADDPPDAELLALLAPAAGTRPVVKVPINASSLLRTDSIRLAGKVIARLPVDAHAMGPPAVNPADHTLIWSLAVADSGNVDLFSQPPGGDLTRLTHAAGDDVDPDWSPDGRYLMFATGRWTPPDDRDYDLALLDRVTGEVRQLTSGPEADRVPHWSPDGTRIAFVRGPTNGGSGLCWVTPDGNRLWCAAPGVGNQMTVAGWRDPSRVAVVDRHGTKGKIVEYDLEQGTWRVMNTGLLAQGHAALTSDGRWARCDCGENGTAVIFPLDEPGLARPVAHPDLPLSSVGWLPPQVRPAVPVLQVNSGGDPLVGIRHVLTTRLDGRVLAPSVVQYRVSDTTVAVVDDDLDAIRGRRPGEVTIEARVGMLPPAETRVTVVPVASKPLLFEAWEDEGLQAWHLFGDPQPKVVTDGGRPALLHAGDQTFDSGLILRSGFTTAGGLGAEFVVSTPVSRPKWQTLRLGLAMSPTVIPGGVSGAAGCNFRAVGSEGAEQMDLYASGATGDRHQMHEGRLPARLLSGAWYRVRLQIFPDGTCGLALDGAPAWRSSAPVSLEGRLHPYIHGQTVGTRILVRSLEMWQGVRPDVDWTRLGPNGLPGPCPDPSSSSARGACSDPGSRRQAPPDGDR